ncbi:lyase family protein [Paracoccus saliphilus]|uniref:3-carboxy-cis,cis-muconate cycloisomerase n=1 Tax=Paracoccus saliphilus TaxID=405559 RepID=A0AA46A758_9RHOB|nr:lyase family protein [Paracoccus saliphilus]WCR03144.1 3-carboxy-cis,cis-muconate cycloisomerase [Paracoccus saliphilus]SIT08329.1 3-carboxy-cis,cis-muconate cycloisomerase [Paracoccus saliphilus]
MMLTDGLFGDEELGGVMGASAQIAAMLLSEAALARVQGRLGIIPKDAAQAISTTAEALHPAPASLTEPTARAGIGAQAVVGALKAACGDDAGWVHFGATSQDIQDTGLILQLREALSIIEGRIKALDRVLAIKATDHATLPVPARTRFQIAAPTTLGAKISVWRAPLIRHLDRLAELRPRLLNVSLYGAAGTGAALAPRMGEIRAAMAAELELDAPSIPWHATRDAIAELGGWLALVTGSLGKIGADLILLGQSEIAEVSAGTGGGSSTMPQKSNPVAAEALVSLARLNAGAVGTLHQAMIHAQERDGSALALEWQTLPDMIIRTGAALRLAYDLADTLSPCPARIDATFANDRGAMMAEAAGFHLSRHMPRVEALKLVAAALTEVAASETETLVGALSRLAPDHDWHTLLVPAENIGDAGSAI